MYTSTATTAEHEGYVEAPRIVVQFDPDRTGRRCDPTSCELEESFWGGDDYGRRPPTARRPFAAWASEYPFVVGRGTDQPAAIEDLARQLRARLRNPAPDERQPEGELAELAADLDDPELAGVLGLIALPLELPPDCELVLR